MGTRWASPGFDSSRQVATFLLGAFVLIYSTVSEMHDVLDATVGLILVGIVPIDAILTRYLSKKG